MRNEDVSNLVKISSWILNYYASMKILIKFEYISIYFLFEQVMLLQVGLYLNLQDNIWLCNLD